MNNCHEMVSVEVISDDEGPQGHVDGAGSSAVAEDVAPEPEAKSSQAAEAAGDADGKEDEESFDVANYQALTAWII